MLSQPDGSTHPFTGIVDESELPDLQGWSWNFHLPRQYECGTTAVTAWRKPTDEKESLPGEDRFRAIASALGESGTETIQSLIETAEDDPDMDHQDKANVLEYVYQDVLPSVRDSEDAYSKDRDGMMIARNMTQEELPDEVVELVNKIESLPDKRPESDS